MSSSVTVAVVGARDIAKELAKKSTTSDITLFHLVSDGSALTVIEPTQYPEKYPPLLFALALADRAVFVIPGLDRSIAETAATLDLFDLPVQVLHGPAVGPEEIQKAFKGLRIATAPIAPLDIIRLRDELPRAVRPATSGSPIVAIDHYFPVKGVGTVALGFVRQGTLTAHAALRLFPTDHTVEIRSIQVHDVEVKAASAGERVGLALKGIEVDELSRGQLLAPEGTLTTGTELRGTAGRTSPYYRGDLRAGAQLHALLGAQFVPAGVTARDGNSLTVETDRPVVWKPGDAFRLADLSVPQGPRCVGVWTL